MLSYPIYWLLGPGSTVTFSATVSFTDPMSIFGPAHTLTLSVTETGPSEGLALFSSTPVTLPDLPPGDPSFTVHGTFVLTNINAGGDGASEIKVIPEPSTLMLCALGVLALLLGYYYIIRARQRAIELPLESNPGV
jgi:hypothetical protein